MEDLQDDESDREIQSTINEAKLIWYKRRYWYFVHVYMLNYVAGS